ncbi:helix-turn-helix domain-containing protein [Cognatiyoonia koreensis]|uniref:helix-turn-helix domain-containing protein n=1 Tax=Cognatiyoonia koreensis TaxID=364200 RepID=UPI0024188ABB|nr:helix-turn-helix domain-containing protein [Cognatiyoonia koreensis]
MADREGLTWPHEQSTDQTAYRRPRLNSAAMKIAGGMTVNEAAMGVGYVSPSQFSREFKRMYGQSPRQWSDAQQYSLAMS